MKLVDTLGAIPNSLPWEHILGRNLHNYRCSWDVPILQTLVVTKILFSPFWWWHVLSFITAIRTHTGEKLPKQLMPAEVIHWTNMFVVTTIILLFWWWYAWRFFSAIYGYLLVRNLHNYGCSQCLSLLQTQLFVIYFHWTDGDMCTVSPLPWEYTPVCNLHDCRSFQNKHLLYKQNCLYWKTYSCRSDCDIHCHENPYW